MLKVLLVDDEPSVIQLLESLIDWKSLGYTVCGTASNGEEALKLLKSKNPHLAIVDIRMPKVTGLQLIQRASEILYLRTKFIILSAYSDFEYAKTAMRYGVSDYILKPIDDEELVPVLNTMNKKICRELNSLESKANKLKLASSNYINKVIKDEKGEEYIERCKHLLDINDNSPLCCALVEINQFEKWMNDYEDVEIHNKRLLVRKAIEEVMGNEYELNIFDDDIHRFGIIITKDMITSKAIYLESIKMKIWQYCHCSVFIALSEETKGIDNIGKVYRQALIALQYRIFQTDEDVLHYEDFKNIPLNYNFYESTPEELIKDVKINNKQGISDKINKVFDEFNKNKCAPEIIESYMKNIEFELVKQIQAHNGNVEVFINRLDDLIRVIGRTGVDRIKKEFYEILVYISDYYKSVSSRCSKDIIIEIKDYILQNYQKDLKLQQIAKAYFLNSVYLGQVFAKTVGMHFNEYLHSIRIDEAKKLLRRTDIKISVIASKVGYNDSEYFVNKFKNLTGLLPSDYRKKYLQEIKNFERMEG